MREILFRGKRYDNGKWVKGHYNNTLRYNNLHWIWDGKNHLKIDPETVGQFTGLTDKNGKKIFEGDILKWDVAEWGGEHCELVEWDYSLLSMRKNDWQHFCEVIGNIHDNPELLGGDAECLT